ncbi:hypothetical protein RSK20926_17372 [Roseobacter sp. SK209-2-6]|uniref:rhodanese-like domain-containing protein n=1 Tax=Roseobacter sp. SK209-2-6 TaxID=388739 RepID=UPI0000F3F292|nr:rhodanese-like domain-containing protein [Roseobacter sp. SK209-2-6]EBA14359.1 hypothetical protein RSK20926_17372 [Roseobacter sp. SK209-2-6]
MSKNKPDPAPDETAPVGKTRRQFLLGGGAVIALAAGGVWWQRRQPAAHDNPRLTPAEAYRKALSGDLTLVDIRTPQEWRSSGVPVGAVQIDMRREDFFVALEEALGGRRDAPVAVICARGGRSARMSLAMKDAGFSKVMDVPEGMLGSRAGPGWIAGNLPVARWEG